ncbi:MAG TPA: glycosyltransferase [Vicinamibacterales bacterium]|jgi:sugar transferase (PEP-CTERM/EpsH1 system associated)
MKLLWLNAGLLLPLDKGGKLRTWHVMRHLAARHDIHYLSFADESQTEADREGMREVCSRLETVPRSDAAKGTWRFYADAARYLVNPAPYAVAKYRSGAYRDRLDRLLATERYDAVVCDFLVPVVNLPQRLPCPSILFTHNVEAEIWRRHVENARNPVAKAALTRQWRRMERFERDALSRFDLVLAVSEADGRTFERLYPGALGAPAHVVQTGVDTSYFTPPTDPALPAHMVFTGSMDWLPNEDGMTYFCREILPRIRQAEPAATLSIVGRAPTPAVQRLAELPGVEVTGRVEDVRPHVARAAVYVVPLRIGGGTRLKIFEAMAMARAVVSTTVGAEGLPVTGGRDIEIADEPARFAQAVVRLMRDAEIRRGVEAAGRRLVVERYDWSAVAHDFERALFETAHKHPVAERAIA